jgi:hypothetical protein
MRTPARSGVEPCVHLAPESRFATPWLSGTDVSRVKISLGLPPSFLDGSPNTL